MEIYTATEIFQVCMNLKNDKDFLEVLKNVIAEASSAIQDKELAAKVASLSVWSLADEYQLACHRGHDAQLCINIAQESLERFANLDKEVA
ncbi:hypothetical protein LS74_001640 [Helicobacter magdeburgensis]|uniref:Uncharacterized protein n=1 Tax=Helicobacter magdeburgensis TaxID=471858 RepID=A0A4U8T4K1_9HELI|nr:hypothetical protein [Helicobacter magdeburgensis]TLD93457.1 hypothetical protein LS74_001640 [Helicobacter magdeburgensis]